jgi:ribosomal protein S18 acetylase RimI-like enzyme
MPVAVRHPIGTDLSALRELFVSSRRKAFSWRPPDEFQLADFDVQTQGELLLVAEDGDGSPVGFISVWEPDNFIHHLYVEPAHQRRGTGGALLWALPNWTQTRYRLKCVRRNEAALAFYRALGFVEVGSGTGDDGEYLELESSGGFGKHDTNDDR